MKDLASLPQLDLRPPDEVMRLARLGKMWPTRLSFLRVLTRDLGRHGSTPECALWQIDEKGYGRAVFTLRYHGHAYALVAISRPLAAAERSDRVIATAWDAAFVLYDGVPEAAELDRIAAEAPLQEAGRFGPRDLVLSRANKSVRLWEHVVARLRSGAQPDPAMVNAVGYLMRTTAVYGNGKFGIADRHLIADRPGLGMSFAAEMLTVWLIRHFTHALVEHVGRAPLDTHLKRHLGIGNATGLGMAPFLVSHPVLLNNWMMVRETALARVRAVAHLDASQVAALGALYTRVAAHLSEWQVPDPAARAEIAALRLEWRRLASAFEPTTLARAGAVETLWQQGQAGSVALQELLLAVLLEPFGPLVDDLAENLTDRTAGTGTPFATTEELRQVVETRFAWALGTDYAEQKACRQFWYVSADKLEPRIGDRFAEPGAERETALDIARRVAALHEDLPERAQGMAAFLSAHPEHLLAVERAQLAVSHPYAEIRDNLIAAETRPIDLLRAKLAMFGATKFDPKSTLWTRVTLAQGAPLAGDLADQPDWLCPVLGA